MKKYEIKYYLKEKIPGKINNLMLNLLFFEFKNKFLQANKYVDKKDLNNKFFLTLMMYEMGNNKNDDVNQYYKKTLKKINSKYLIEKYINQICYELQKKDYENVEELLKSFVYSELVKSAKLIKNEICDYITLVIKDGKKVNFTNIPLSENITKHYNGYCHQITSEFIKNKPSTRVGVMCFLKNHLYGKYYHSFFVENGIVYDMAHNIVMNYNDYIKIINPNIILDETGNILIENMNNIYNDHKFNDNEWCDLAIYGISKS